MRKGQETIVKCEAQGDSPLSITWSKDKSLLKFKDDSRYELSETATKDGLNSQVIIKNSDRRDSALFTCRATNPYGDAETNIQIIMQGEYFKY